MAKKSFKKETNPALSFISPQSIENDENNLVDVNEVNDDSINEKINNKQQAVDKLNKNAKTVDDIKNKNNIDNTSETDVKNNLKNKYYKEAIDEEKKSIVDNKHNNDYEYNIDNTQITHNENKTDNKYNTHKNSKQVISRDIENNEKKVKVKKGPGRPAIEGETKTKRLNLLILPSLFQDLEKVATMKRTSVNNLINLVLKDYVDENIDLISLYREVFGDE